MKVLMIGNDSSVKGGITSVINQLREHDWKNENVELHFIPTYIETNAINKILFFGVAYFKIIWALLTFGPDVIHIHMSYRGSFQRTYLIHKLCLIFGVQDVIHLHGSEFKKWYDESKSYKQKKIRSLLRECSAMIVLGDEWKRRIKEIEPKTNTIVVSNTVSIPIEIVKWNDSRFQVLFLGVLIKRKGVDILLEAVSLLHSKGNLDHVQFVIAGTGEEEIFLKGKSALLGLEDKVRFLGWTEGEVKRQLMKESQMLVLPSYNEGLPMAVLEAISYGVPVVATEVGDMKAAILDDQNGYLVQPGDAKILAIAMEKIFRSDKKAWETYSYHSRNIAQTKFSEKNYFCTLLNLYHSVVDSKVN
ncbi:glycosyl transferases group 1 [Trichococcus palustris]|uniref:Glycosyl transferases group 1 n=1 Tax=Trichococcus palustris TaxID=140314 RepID=A0A143YUY0_9LACT|nr:glycosyltransferase family 4 protein [Trichococcus palustris]CZQ96520.1 glycosyl transferases group 1 [Trichococcus palustris]SFK73793.1 Glycosyltransferase involved in cell wall bisynthesis [Trichococcus palustris]